MRSLFVFLLMMIAPSLATAQEPPLPQGLDKSAQEKTETTSTEEPALPDGLGAALSEEPALPSGLGASQSEEPALPSGLGDDASEETSFGKGDSSSFNLPLTGFLEGRIGPRLQDDPNEGAFSIGEARLRLETQFEPGAFVIRVVGDGVFDQVVDTREPDLDTGEGAFDLREANIVWRPLDFADLKVGRQILTWGVGDLVFINDLFPKDYNSFFIGRDDEYLKAPSDAARLSLFSSLANLDFVYTPRFDPDRYIDGSRLSYYNPLAGAVVGENFILNAMTPNEWFSDDEFAMRLYRQVGAFEVAAYGYVGYYKGPSGITATGDFIFPELAVYGASLRGPFRGGILTAEIGRYISRDDHAGDNPLLPNGDFRVLVGYEKEVAEELTASVQYYAEFRDDQDAYLAALPAGAFARDRARHLLTLRLTKLAMNQNLTLSAFNFWSPNEHDGHLRLRASYKMNDNWLVEAGGNIFYGPNEAMLFSQLKDNTNLFFAARRSF